MVIEKLDHGYVIRHHHRRDQVATPEHVADIIIERWPDVTDWLKIKLGVDPLPHEADE